MESKQKLQFSILDNSNVVDVPEIKEVKDGRSNIIRYGEDNLFPQYIWGLYTHSSLMSTIIRGIVDYVMGNGIIKNEKTLGIFLSNVVNKDDDELADIIEKVALDYVLYDGFALQIFRDSDGKINELYNIDFFNCRKSEDGKYIVYSDKWKTYNTKTTKYEIFDPNKKQRNSIFYFKGKTAPQINVYPIPSYIGSLADIRTSTEISNFHLNSVINDFNGNLIINLNSGEVDDETKRSVEKKFKEKFCGTDNAGKFILNFNENKESAITIERLQSDDFDKRYDVLSKAITENIFVAFRCSPQLLGLTSAATGFNTQEYESAYKLFNKTVILPIQNRLTRAFKKIFGGDVFEFIPFSLNEIDKVSNN